MADLGAPAPARVLWIIGHTGTLEVRITAPMAWSSSRLHTALCQALAERVALDVATAAKQLHITHNSQHIPCSNRLLGEVLKCESNDLVSLELSFPCTCGDGGARHEAMLCFSCKITRSVEAEVGFTIVVAPRRSDDAVEVLRPPPELETSPNKWSARARVSQVMDSILEQFRQAMKSQDKREHFFVSLDRAVGIDQNVAMVSGKIFEKLRQQSPTSSPSYSYAPHTPLRTVFGPRRQPCCGAQRQEFQLFVENACNECLKSGKIKRCDSLNAYCHSHKRPNARKSARPLSPSKNAKDRKRARAQTNEKRRTSPLSSISDDQMLQEASAMRHESASSMEFEDAASPTTAQIIQELRSEADMTLARTDAQLGLQGTSPSLQMMTVVRSEADIPVSSELGTFFSPSALIGPLPRIPSSDGSF
eukprot:m.122483 g.122483  ORF g.122483 m.122483 type:complete len:420 (+) comp9628_c0_seq3:382-1641(+)